MRTLYLGLGVSSGFAAALYWLWGLVYFPTLLDDYRAVSQTISELGAFSTPLADRINYGWSLPVGLLQCLAVYALWRSGDLPTESRHGWAAFAGIGVAYVICAFFPCDLGSPLWGSGRQLLHNLFGGLEYLSGGFGLLLLAASFRDRRLLARALKWSGLTVWAALLMMSIPYLFDIRGVVQRIAETLLFGWLAWGCAMKALGISDATGSK